MFHRLWPQGLIYCPRPGHVGLQLRSMWHPYTMSPLHHGRPMLRRAAPRCVPAGGMSKNYTHIKQLMFTQPEVLHGLLQKLADSVVTYIKYQVGEQFPATVILLKG